MGSVPLLRWLWEPINLHSELAAMDASLVTAPVLLATLGVGPETEWVRLGIMAAVTTGTAVEVASPGCARCPHALDGFLSLAS